MEIGDSFTQNIETVPSKFANINRTSSSSDESVVACNGDELTAIENGEAIITTSAIFHGKTYSADYNVTVKDLEYDLTSTRTATGITIARKTNELEIGEEFSLQAYVLSGVTEEHPYPYGYSDDNLVKYSSDNPSVCRVKNGVLYGVSTGIANITVSDIDGTVSETFSVQVVEETSLQYTEDEVWTVNADDYDWTDAETTTLAFIDIVTKAEEDGMKKIVFPNQTYFVSPAYGTINIPTETILDFNNSIIQIEESALTSTGYQMFLFQDTEYSSIENAIIYGERDLIDGTGHEQCISVEICGTSVKSGLKNCVTSKSPGFNISFGNTNRKVSGVKLSGIVAGGLDANGNEIDESYAFRSDYTSISSIGNARGQIWLGNMQGYGGYLYLSARVYSLYFYDANKTFLSVIPNCIQYYAYQKPENAVYARIAFWQASAPTSGDPDFSSVAHLHSFDKPDRCYVKNCTLEDNYSLAISAQGGEGTLIEGCVFKNNGYRDPHSHIDWEDGRQHNKGHILRNCTFEGGGIAVCVIGSDGLVVHNNVLTDTSMDVRGEAQNSRIWLNQFVDAKALVESKTDMVFSQNYAIGNSAFTLTDNEATNFKIHVGS